MVKKFFLFALSLTFLFSTVNSQNKRVALIIGNSEYQTSTMLENPVNDAESIAKTLDLLGFEVILKKNANQKEMKMAIDGFGEILKDYDVGLFFYAGHGIQVNGYNYLIPIDANLSSEGDAEYDCINTGRILSKMESSGSKTNIVILDACRNNPFEKSWDRSLSNKGLAFMEAPFGSLVAYATSPGNTASDGSGADGLYTESLLKYIGDPDLNILQVFQKVRKDVREKSEGDQIPWESTSLEDNFYFNQNNAEHISLTEKSIPSAKTNETFRDNLVDKYNWIRNNPEFIYAEASSQSMQEADLIAKGNLNNKIIRYFTEEVNKQIADRSYNIEPLKQEYYNIYIGDIQSYIARKTYSHNNSEVVIKYIPKKEIIKFLELKENRIRTFYESAQTAERNENIGDALKYYYWSYALSKIHPVRFFNLDQTENDPLNTISDHIENLLTSTTCSLKDSSYVNGVNRFQLEFYSNKKLVENIEYKYWNGVSWSDIVSINNGVGFIDLYPEYSKKDLQVKIEYKNINKSRFDKELNKAIEILDNNKFEKYSSILVTKDFSRDNDNKAIFSEFNDIIEEIILRVERNDKTFDENLFTRNGFDVYKKLLIYGNASIPNFNLNYKTAKFGDNYYLRGVPAKFKFQNNTVEFTEKLCFQFDSQKRIDNITFSISDKAAKDILSMNQWPEDSKLQIINFLENYKTAYALKRYDYINQIFSDNALIIVGQKLEKSPDLEDNKYVLMGDNYKLTRLTKEQYMYRLRNVFKRNEFVNIQFEENVVKKRDRTSDVYGINIKQNYYSSTYADQGYLFLMVDLQDNEKPKIYVRAWQPEKFDDGHIINLSDFTY